MPPTLAMVTPQEWLSRTSVRFGRRLATTQRVDRAYADYYASRSEANRIALHVALEDYLKEKGGYWEKVNRNVNSGGLMKYIWEQTAPDDVGPRTASQSDRVMLDLRVPETRHGVLYLWENTTVETQWGAILLEGALTTGSAAVSLAGDLQDFADGDPRAFGYAIGAGAGTLGAMGVAYLREGRTADEATPPPPRGRPRANAMVGGVRPPLPPPPPPRPPAQGNTVVTLDQVQNSVTSLTRIRLALGRFFQAIYDAIRDAVHWIWNKIITHQEVVISTASAVIEKVILIVLEEVAKAAAPFVGAGIDIGRGVVQTIKGVKDRLEAYFARAKFVVRPGHPTEIANAIERQMNWVIGKGLYSTIKGGAKLAGNFFSAGASAIVDAIAAGIEFATKVILRLVEGKAIQQWLVRVREACATKQGSDPQRPALAFDTVAFNALFSAGCNASACVPMMTLNSGITGDQMMFMKMFDDTSDARMVDQRAFDAATGYFTQLKQFGRAYLGASGFRFSSQKPDVQGYLHHAVTHHESGNLSVVDAALTFLG